MKKQIDAVDLFLKSLTQEQLKAAFKTYNTLPTHKRNKALQDIIAPAIDKFNAYLEQENNVSYLAYLLEHVFNEKGEL